MLFAFFWVFVHGEHAYDDVLVLYVAYLYELLEAVPVFSCIACRNVGVDVGFLELLPYIVFAGSLTLAGELVVEVEATFGRCVGKYLYVSYVKSFTVSVDFLEEINEFLYGIVLEFALAEICLVHKELDVCLEFLLPYSLECVGSETRIAVDKSLAIEFRSSQNTVSDLHFRYLDYLLAYLGIKGEIHVAFLHSGLEVEVCLHGIASAYLVRNGLVVAHDLLALEGCAFATCHLTVCIAQLRSNGHHSLGLHVLGREGTVDCCRNLSTLCLKWYRIYIEVVSRQRTHL